jgi:Holliday junction resolvase RusA-like endonuclease
MKAEPLISFEVEGAPVTQGSKKAWYDQKNKRTIMTEDRSVELTSWRREVSNAAKQALAGAGIVDPTTDPIRVRLQFYFKRPIGHYGSGKNAKVLKDSASPYPHGRVGDIDKITRAILDSMTDARVFVDDSQVVTLGATKRWADRFTGLPGVVVDVERLT